MVNGIISGPRSNASNWSVTSIMRLQDRRIRDPARSVAGSLRSTDYAMRVGGCRMLGGAVTYLGLPFCP